MKRIVPILLTPIAAAILVLGGYIVGVRRPSAPTMPATPATAPAPARRVLYWYDPMIPAEHHDKPGLSSMGMTMVPRYADGDAAPGSVHIDPATVQNLGIRTAYATRRVLADEIRAPGMVAWDLDEAAVVSARADGIITRLVVREPYATVKVGAALAELTAPAWSSAVAEYEALGEARSADAKALRGAARERLTVLGLEPADLRSMGRHGAVTLHAPQDGVVTSLEVREGQRVAAGQTLMRLNGLVKVWVEASLPQALAGEVRAGTPVAVRSDVLPGKRLAGTVERLLPDLDGTSRTQRARIVLPNPGGALSPGQFVQVVLEPVQGEATLVVPDEALITTGEQVRVIVQEGDGRFRPVAVRTGRSAGGYTQVLDGLEDGARIVLSGQFLIDSEASLSGALDRLGTSPAAAESIAAPTAAMPGMPTDAMPGQAATIGGQP